MTTRFSGHDFDPFPECCRKCGATAVELVESGGIECSNSALADWRRGAPMRAAEAKKRLTAEWDEYERRHAAARAEAIKVLQKVLNAITGAIT